MRADGTKVSLNGAGGDELFAGYSSYFYAAQIENLAKGRLAQLVDNELNWTETSGHLRPTGLPLVRLARHVGRRKLLGAGGEPHAMDFVGGRISGDRMLRTLSETLSSDLENTKMPYWLRSGDKDYMGVPFEVRAPFLDYRVVELAFRLPSTYHIRHGWHKWILRKALEGVVPDDVLWRRKKMGFPFPNKRFGVEHRSILEMIRRNAQNPYVNGRAAAPFERDWYATSFLLWYELFFNENLELFDRVTEHSAAKGSAPYCGYVPQFLCGPGS
jgi:asparagine synthase (glutamine-hydrolysing)